MGASSFFVVKESQNKSISGWVRPERSKKEHFLVAVAFVGAHPKPWLANLDALPKHGWRKLDMREYGDMHKGSGNMHKSGVQVGCCVNL